MNANKILELFSLEGRVAIITGGAGQLGVRHAEILNDAGAHVYSFDIVQNPLLEGIAHQIFVDITDKKEVTEKVKHIIATEKRIDILVNNAAFNPKVGSDEKSTGENCWSPHEEYDENLWKKEFDIGLNGALYCIQAVAESMIKRNSGSIVNIASTSAITAPDHRKYKPGRFKSAAYPVIKTALLGLTRSWASYFSRVAPGVRVNSLCPGAVNFGSMEPDFLAKLGQRNMLGRPAFERDYQGALLFLCSDASAFMTASMLVIDGGQTAW